MHRRRFLEAAAALAAAPLAGTARAQSRARRPEGSPALPPPTLDDFVLAVKNDRVQQVREFLARGFDPDSVGADGWPVLVVASREGNLRTVEALLDAGAKPDVRNPFGDTALMLASLNGHVDVARRLRAKGAAVDHAGWTPLIYAATGGHDELVRFLLGEGADIDARSPNGTTALMMAVREERFSTAVLLIERGADVAHANENGATALQWAERTGDAALVARLRKAGAR
ncbi:MAG: hypothetical protein BroJett026_32610 [Betaproteobacteria bacterium]|nr:MAG: hypothetical protein BroJett026_32610 [Betaproteobacteria bacterium]